MSGNQNISFFQGELRGLKYQMLSEDLLKQFKQSLSNEHDKSLLEGFSWNLTDTCRLVSS